MRHKNITWAKKSLVRTPRPPLDPPLDVAYLSSDVDLITPSISEWLLCLTICTLLIFLNNSVKINGFLSLVTKHSMQNAILFDQSRLSVRSTLVLSLNAWTYHQTFSTFWYGHRSTFFSTSAFTKVQRFGTTISGGVIYQSINLFICIRPHGSISQ